MSSSRGYTIIESPFEVVAMCYYAFFTQTLKEELIDKINEFLQEEEMVYACEIDEINSNSSKMFKMIYILSGNKEKCDEGMAHVICDVIQKNAIKNVCDKFLKNREDLTMHERQEISEAFLLNNYISRQEGISYASYYWVYLPIYKEIREKRCLNIEGWLQFRLEKYKVLLKDILEQFVADYVTKKDVVSFIRLLREATLLAVPLEECIHIIYNKEGKIQIYNKEHINVTGHYIKKYCKDLLLDSMLTREDFILHVLITISPKKLIIHQAKYMKNKQFVSTLEIIFGESMTYCKGCYLCEDEIENKKY